jgi:hypothetical protein
MPKLKNYIVSVLVDATVVIRVKAKSPEEAQQLAEERACVPGLCHCCSKNLELGDIIPATGEQNFASECDDADFEEDEP